MRSLAIGSDVDDEENDTGAEPDRDLKRICIHFDGDVNYNRLVRQLAVLRDTCQGKTITSVKDVCSHLSTMPALQDVFGEVCIFLKLCLVIPTSSATAERSFSAMRRLKTYLRSTMTTERLNSMMVLHVHRDLLDDIEEAPIVDEFVACNEMRKDIFGV